MSKLIKSSDYEIVKDRLIRHRAEGNTSPTQELVDLFRREFPQVDERMLNSMENSQGYINSIIATQKYKIAAAIPDMIDELLVKGKKGNIQVIRLLMELANEPIGGPLRVQNNTQNNFYDKTPAAETNDGLVSRICDISESLDTDSEDIGE